MCYHVEFSAVKRLTYFHHRAADQEHAASALDITDDVGGVVTTSRDSANCSPSHKRIHCRRSDRHALHHDQQESNPGNLSPPSGLPAGAVGGLIAGTPWLNAIGTILIAAVAAGQVVGWLGGPGTRLETMLMPNDVSRIWRGEHGPWIWIDLKLEFYRLDAEAPIGMRMLHPLAHSENLKANRHVPEKVPWTSRFMRLWI
jgi:hypothetical protein